MTEETSGKKKLIDELDETAISLLRRVRGESDLDKGSVELLVEQVKGFDSVVKWADVRQKVNPEETKQGSKFDDIRDTFHGSKNGSGGGRGRSAAPADESDDAASLR